MAKEIVTGELYESITGKLFEIGRQIRQKSGYPFDPGKLNKHLQNAIEGEFYKTPVPIFIRDKTKHGWRLLEHVPRRITSVNDLELVSFLKQGESPVTGEEVLRRARLLDANHYGQEDAEWLLEHQDEIPAKFRKHNLIFTETVWENLITRRGVICLGWGGGAARWHSFFFWLHLDCDPADRLIRCRK